MIIILKACGMLNPKIHDVFSYFFRESFWLICCITKIYDFFLPIDYFLGGTIIKVSRIK